MHTRQQNQHECLVRSLPHLPRLPICVPPGLHGLGDTKHLYQCSSLASPAATSFSQFK